MPGIKEKGAPWAFRKAGWRISDEHTFQQHAKLFLPNLYSIVLVATTPDHRGGKQNWDRFLCPESQGLRNKHPYLLLAHPGSMLPVPRGVYLWTQVPLVYGAEWGTILNEWRSVVPSNQLYTSLSQVSLCVQWWLISLCSDTMCVKPVHNQGLDCITLRCFIFINSPRKFYTESSSLPRYAL